MKQLALLISICLGSSLVIAQNGAHTAIMVNAISARAIDKGIFEFEPNFSSQYTYENWDSDGNLIRSLGGDSVIVESALGFRLQYSPMQGMEVASFVQSDMSSAYAGIKYILIDSSYIDLTAFAGITFPMGNRTLRINNRTITERHAYGIGFGMTREFEEGTVIDLSTEYQHTGLGYSESVNDLFIFMDVGHYINDDLLLFSSIGYQTSSFMDSDSYVMSIYPGITIERGRTFVIMLNAQFDLIGRNAQKVTGGNIALTMVFD